MLLLVTFPSLDVISFRTHRARTRMPPMGSASRTHCRAPPHAVPGPTNRLSPRIRFKTVLSPQSLCHCLPSPKLQKPDANRSFCVLTGFSELLLEFPLLLQSEMSSERVTCVFHHPSTSTWSVWRGLCRTVSGSPPFRSRGTGSPGPSSTIHLPQCCSPSRKPQTKCS